MTNEAAKAIIEIPADQIDMDIYKHCLWMGESIAEALSFAMMMADDSAVMIAHLVLAGGPYARPFPE